MIVQCIDPPSHKQITLGKFYFVEREFNIGNDNFYWLMNNDEVYEAYLAERFVKLEDLVK